MDQETEMKWTITFVGTTTGWRICCELHADTILEALTEAVWAAFGVGSAWVPEDKGKPLCGVGEVVGIYSGLQWTSEPLAVSFA